jgi:hypothetical protein
MCRQLLYIISQVDICGQRQGGCPKKKMFKAKAALGEFWTVVLWRPLCCLVRDFILYIFNLMWQLRRQMNRM